MDMTAFDYLLRLAALAIAFVGFATIVITLRRALGGELSPFHILLVRIYTETGLAVAVGSLLPSLMILFGLPSFLVWRLTSVLAGVLAPAFLIVYLRRRGKSAPGPIPLRVYVRYGISAIAILALWLNAIGLPAEPNGAPYASVLTWFLFSAGLVFLQTLDEVLYDQPKPRQV